MIDSRVIDAAVEQLLASEALWSLVEGVAQSPAVTEAISHQGLSFADQIVSVVRVRSRNADDHIERIAKRLARRTPPDPAPVSGGPADAPLGPAR